MSQLASPFRRLIKYAFLIIVLFNFFCQSTSNYIKRQVPDSSFATAHVGDVIYSTTDFKLENDRQRVVYKYWKFGKSDSKSITVIYEENLDYIKLKPDLREEKVYEFDKNYTVRLQGNILDIYELSAKSMVYYMKSGG